MHKNALFLLKNCKNRPALGAASDIPLPIEKSWLRHCGQQLKHTVVGCLGFQNLLRF